MDAVAALRDFFDRQLGGTAEVRRHLGVDEPVSRPHLIHHLVERTLRRASADAAAQQALGGADTTEVSWKHCLMVAALVELRPLRLAARGPI